MTLTREGIGSDDSHASATIHRKVRRSSGMGYPYSLSSFVASVLFEETDRGHLGFDGLISTEDENTWCPKQMHKYDCSANKDKKTGCKHLQCVP